MTGNELQFGMTLVSCLGCGLIAGVFFAFSAFVMKALSRLPAREGIAAMQSINIVVLNPWFLGAFFGTALLCLVELAWSLLKWHGPESAYRVVGSALYLIGTFFVTIVFNVPRNEELAKVKPVDDDHESNWTSYVSSWTTWNHVRTVAALAAAACFGMALS